MTAHAPVEREEPPHDQIFVPKPIAIMMIALALFTVASTGLARSWGVGVTHEGKVAATRTVFFTVAMTPEGPIDAELASGGHVHLADAHQEIFPRLILQGIATIRARDGAPAEAPIMLVVGTDGERLLIDPATHRTVRLAAFGPENGRSFDALLRGAAA